MNALTSKQRKLIYLAGIVLLMVPVIWLGMPAAEPQDPSGRLAGKLARLRYEYDLGESNLGEVDPASATMNLVLLGMRGPAASLLQLEANDLKDTKNWAQLQATVESIIMLQPHFMEVWRFQGWNLAYNVSVEWDAVPDRWYWVKEGAKFLQRGTRRNRRYPELYWETGRILGHKIGRSDEWRYFRQYYKADPDTEQFGENRSDPAMSVVDGEEKPDNFLAAKAWFEHANNAEDNHEQHLMMRMLFRQYPARAQIEYAEAMQREGNFNEIVREAWSQSFVEWSQSYGKEWYRSPGGWLFLEVGKSDKLGEASDDIKEILARNDYELDDKDKQQLMQHWVDRYQKTANYPYWRERCLAEGEQNTIRAHDEIYRGQQLFKEGEINADQYRPRAGVCDDLASLNLPDKHLAVMQVLCESQEIKSWNSLRSAVEMSEDELESVLKPLVNTRKLVEPISECQILLESGMAKFAKMLNDHPNFVQEDNTIEEGLMALLYWRHVLTLNGLPVPEEYPLKHLWNAYQERLPEVEMQFRRENGL